MKPLDLLVLGVIAMIALSPLFGRAIAAIRAAARRPGPAPIKAPAEGWRAGWVQTLMELQNVLEQDGKNAAAVKMNRELIWLILGGDGK